MDREREREREKEREGEGCEVYTRRENEGGRKGSGILHAHDVIQHIIWGMMHCVWSFRQVYSCNHYSIQYIQTMVGPVM